MLQKAKVINLICLFPKQKLQKMFLITLQVVVLAQSGFTALLMAPMIFWTFISFFPHQPFDLTLTTYSNIIINNSLWGQCSKKDPKHVFSNITAFSVMTHRYKYIHIIRFMRLNEQCYSHCFSISSFAFCWPAVFSMESVAKIVQVSGSLMNTKLIICSTNIMNWVFMCCCSCFGGPSVNDQL